MMAFLESMGGVHANLRTMRGYSETKPPLRSTSILLLHASSLGDGYGHRRELQILSSVADCLGLARQASIGTLLRWREVVGKS
jgi:hypothetical protein